MVTPGLAGGITMLITNTVWVQFGLEPRWTGLAISSLLSFLVLAALAETNKPPVWQQGIYFCLNTLIIFSVAAGGNTIGRRVTSTVSALQAITSTLGIPISTAHAQESSSSPVTVEQLEEKIKQIEERLQQVEQQRLEATEVLLNEVRKLQQMVGRQRPEETAELLNQVLKLAKVVKARQQLESLAVRNLSEHMRGRPVFRWGGEPGEESVSLPQESEDAPRWFFGGRW
jgi:hypothetical protein